MLMGNESGDCEMSNDGELRVNRSLIEVEEHEIYMWSENVAGRP